MKSYVLYNVCVGVCFVVGSSAASAADPVTAYDYWIRIPRTSKTCVEEAQALAARFGAATHVRVLGQTCRAVVDTRIDGKPEALYSLAVTYEAPEELTLTTAVFKPDYNSNNALSAYARYSECVADLDHQIQLFEKYTRLPAIAGYCEDLYSSKQGFTMKIDGFGEPDQMLGVFATEFSSRVTSGFFDRIRSLLVSQGSTIAREQSGTFYFYAKDLRPLREEHFANFGNPAECQAQLEFGREILVNSGSRSSVVECVATAGWTALYGVGNGNLLLIGKDRVSTHYYSFAECLGDRSRVAKELKGIYGDDFYGTICQEDILSPGRYVLKAYTP